MDIAKIVKTNKKFKKEKIPIKKLEKDFYIQNTVNVAKDLIGKYMEHIVDGEKLLCRITETEAYTGIEDKACHAYGGKKTQRTQALYLEGGHAYVYLIYGMYYCMNIVTEKQDIPCAVLIRAGEPINGLDKISFLRYKKSYQELTKTQLKNLLNGPGKFCIGMAITKEQNKQNLLDTSFTLYENENEPKPRIGSGKRINIDYAEEYTSKLWRFFIQ